MAPILPYFVVCVHISESSNIIVHKLHTKDAYYTRYQLNTRIRGRGIEAQSASGDVSKFSCQVTKGILYACQWVRSGQGCPFYSYTSLDATYKYLNVEGKIVI